MQLLKIKNFGFILVLLLSASVVIISCGDDDDDECKTENLTYDNFAKDFLITNCASQSGCHVDANKNEPGIGSYETYEDTKNVVDQMRFLGAINHQDGFSDMPKGGDKLDDCSIDKLTAWINDGAPE